MSDSSRLLIDEQPLQLLPSLAVKFGLNEAIVLQQVHYWLRINKQANRNFKHGRWWTYSTHAAWLKQFPFWSDKTLRRAIASLTEAGLLIACNLADDARDRTLWYTIDYDVLNDDTPQPPCGQNDHMQAPAPERANAPGQNDHMGFGQNDHMQPAQCDQMQASHLTTCLRGAETPTESPTETYTENTTTNTSARTQAAASPKKNVVVVFANTISDSDAGSTKPTKPTKTNTSGMTPLTEIVAPVGAHIGEDSPAVKALVEMDVKPISTARRIVAERGEKLVLDWVEAVKGKYADTSKRGPAAYLVAALGGDEAWDLPPAYLAARRDKQRRAEQAQEEKRRAEQIKLAAEAERQEAEEAKRCWEALTPAQQAEIERDARDEIGKRPLGEKWLEKQMGKDELHQRCLELAMQREKTTRFQKAA